MHIILPNDHNPDRILLIMKLIITGKDDVLGVFIVLFLCLKKTHYFSTVLTVPEGRILFVYGI